MSATTARYSFAKQGEKSPALGEKSPLNGEKSPYSSSFVMRMHGGVWTCCNQGVPPTRGGVGVGRDQKTNYKKLK